ncbi:MAG TPA: hypothetical protein VGH91_12105 [Gammaproteobacteria bacterium]|jgi:hypothetical protein
MPWTIETQDGGELLEVTYQGDFAAEELRIATLEIVDALVDKGILRLLLDCRDAHFNVPTIAVYQLPELYDAKGLSRQVRAAVVKPRDGYHLELFEFYEDVCRNRGYFAMLFDDTASARQWLHTEGPTQKPD